MERHCYQFVCDNYPDCLNSGGSCCAIEAEEELEIARSECFDLDDKPLYLPGRLDGRTKRADK